MEYILPKEGNFYKANLHSHTTDSDGYLSPKALCELYKSHGYSVLCITDHDRMFDRSALCEDGFLVLNGFEHSVGQYSYTGRLVHIGMIATRPDIKPFVMLTCPDASQLNDDEYTKAVNNAVRIANENGFLCIQNHPRWSLDTDKECMDYEGFIGMEVYNHFSEIMGVEDYNVAMQQSLARKGKDVFAIMADDDHNKPGWVLLQSNKFDITDTSFGGWIVIKAPSLTYDNIINALKNGDFYASTGPEFYELYITNENKLKVKCSEVKSITLSTQLRRGLTKFSRAESFTEAEFEIEEGTEFVQIAITDEYGKRAVSQIKRMTK